MFQRKPEGERRSLATWAASVAIHLVVIGGLVQVLLYSTPVAAWLHLRDTDRVTPQEHLTFVQLPKSEPSRENNAGQRGGNGRPVTKTEVVPPLIAPRETPSTLPPVPSTPAAPRSTDEPGTGPLVGGGGATKGIRPSYNDPRLWGAPNATLVEVPKTSKQRLDSVIVAEIRKYSDSVAANTSEPTKFEKGDWTANGPGGKWGVDKQFIRLGKVSIPTAILGMLPLNVSGNPIAYEKNKALAQMHDQIMEQAQTAMTEDEFKKAVKRIRERKERERKDADKDKSGKPVVMP